MKKKKRKQIVSFYIKYLKIPYKKKKRKTPFFDFILFGFVLFLLLLGVYIIKFGSLTLSSSKSDWGAFGDFLGGTLNPTFAFLSLIAILTTIKIQSNELKASRKELELTRAELSRSTDAQKEQSNSIKIQNFENTFFNMLDLHNKIVDNIKIPQEHELEYKFVEVAASKRRKSDFNALTDVNQSLKKNLVLGRDAINTICEKIDEFIKDRSNPHTPKIDKSINWCRPFPIVYDLCHQYYHKIIGHYFGNIYQILKFISESDEKIIDQKRYANLFRSQFSSQELKLLFYHCTGKVGSRKFKKLLEEFCFLEHLSIEKDNESFKYIFYKKIYDNSAFEENQGKKFDEIETMIKGLRISLQTAEEQEKINVYNYKYVFNNDIPKYKAKLKEEMQKNVNSSEYNKYCLILHDLLIVYTEEDVSEYLVKITVEG